MASVQQAHGANQLTDKEKAEIEEAMKEAKSVLENSKKNAKASQDQLVLAAGVMKNKLPCALKLERSHSWKGMFIANPPDIMGKCTGAFVHEGTALEQKLPVLVGSKGLMIYGTHNDKAYPQLGWLLAWDKPKEIPNGTIKVYVEAGNLSRLMKMELTEIEHKLNESHCVSRFWDSDTGAAACAKIENLAGNVALVGATFDQFNNSQS